MYILLQISTNLLFSVSLNFKCNVHGEDLVSRFIIKFSDRPVDNFVLYPLNLLINYKGKIRFLWKEPSDSTNAVFNCSFILAGVRSCKIYINIQLFRYHFVDAKSLVMIRSCCFKPMLLGYG